MRIPSWLMPCLLLANAASGCVANTTVPNADAGSLPDGGGGRDGGKVGPDGSAENDGGPATDSSVPQLDGGTDAASDGGRDGGRVEADGSAETDGGPATDSSVPQPDGGVDALTVPCANVAASGPLLDLGHVAPIRTLLRTAERLLSLDSAGQWRLWDAATATPIARGDVSCGAQSCAALAGDLVALRQGDDLEMRRATDGGTLGTLTGVFPDAQNWGVAGDGSYVFVANAQGLSAYSSAGDNLLSRAGNYAAANVLATASALLVARGAAGAQVIETVTLANESSTSPAFLGSFARWFVDGESFLTYEGQTYRVYGANAAQKKILSLPLEAGVGDYVWSTGYGRGPFSLYRVSGDDTPIFTTSFAGQISASTQAVVLFGSSGAAGIVVDLSVPVPTARNVSVISTETTALVVGEDGQWALGNEAGTIHRGEPIRGEPETYGCGVVRGMAISEQNTLALAVANQVLVVDVATRTLQRVVPFRAGQLALSADGSVLAALDDRYRRGRSLDVYALPSGDLIHSYVQPTSNTMLFDFALSRDGSRLARAATQPDSAYTDIVMSDVTGANVTFSLIGQRYFFGGMEVSPTGQLIAISSGDTKWSMTTNIYEGGSLVGAAEGTTIAWLDDDQLLVRRIKDQDHQAVFSYLGVVDKLGALKVRTGLPDLGEPSVLAHGAKLYDHVANVVRDVTTGDVSWTGPDAPTGLGVASDAQAVYVLDGDVVVRELP